MESGIPAETRADEKRAMTTPETVKKLSASGHHTVLVQPGTGIGIAVALV